MKRSVELPLAELTAMLIRDVHTSIMNLAAEQAEDYIELAREVGMPVEVYQEKCIGISEDEKRETVDRYIRENVLPMLALPTTKIPSTLYFADAYREAFLAHFQGIIVHISGANRLAADVVEPSQSASFPWRVARFSLIALVTAKIRRDAAHTHARATTLLRAGVPNIVMTGGEVCMKVTMGMGEVVTGSIKNGASRSEPRLGMRVRLANERSMASTKNTEMVGAVTIEFSATTHQPIDLGAVRR